MSNTLTKNKTSTKEGYKKTKLGWIPEEWETKILGEFFEFKNGLNKEKEFFGYGTPIINYMDVNKKGSLMLDDINGKVSLSESEIQRFNIKKGDVFFTRTSETIDEIAYSTVLVEDVKDGVFSGFVLRARPRKLGELDINFTKYCFSTYIARKEIMSKSTFTTRALTNGRFLSEVNLLIPPLPEQHKIAQILSTWDKAIALQEQLITQKQALKKGLMQDLLTGKKRFPGFEEEWSTPIINEVFNFIKTTSFSRAQLNYSDKNQIYYIHYGDIHSKYKKPILDLEETQEIPKLNSDIKLPNSIQYLKNGDVIIADASEDYNGVGKAIELQNVNEKKVISGLHTFALRDKKDLTTSGFRAYIFKNPLVKKALKTIATGSKVYGISKGNVQKFQIVLPSIEEQKKIASVLSNFDTEIEKLITHKESLIQQKQGLMQQLLSGEKRVKI
jgi:type I restriction enzyme S subunit